MKPLVFQFQRLCVAFSSLIVVNSCQYTVGNETYSKHYLTSVPENSARIFVQKDTLKNATTDSLSKIYLSLDNYLKNYQQIALKGGWELLSPATLHLAFGDSSNEVFKLKKQLNQLSDLSVFDSSIVFDSVVQQAVVRFQNRHGLLSDGVVGKRTIHFLRIPLQRQIQQIEVNLQRLKNASKPKLGDYLVVNIPSFRLYVYQSGKFLWSCKVVVGEAISTKKTVVFNDEIEYIVFNPYWNIPQGIVLQQILPAIHKDKSYLTAYGIEVLDQSGHLLPSSAINWSKYQTKFPYRLRQKPGKNNALGTVKFMFPNKYAIYLHDTPQKMLFGQSKRSFSHGCIRVQDPVKLAQFLLQKDQKYTLEKTRFMMKGTQEVVVRLKQHIPISIVYYTVWVDRGGVLNFRDDVYGYD